MNLGADPENLLLLEQLAEHAEQAFFIFDCRKNEITYVSPAYEVIWESARTALKGSFTRVLDTVFSEDRKHVLRCWNWYKQPRRANHKQFEFRIITPKGKLKWICLDVYLVFSEENTLFLTGWARDATENKQYTDVMLKFSARKNATLEILSHDLAGFLSLIKNLAGSTSQSVSMAISEKISQNLVLIQKICQHSTDLISNLVNHEFLESASVSLNKERKNVVAIIEDVIATYRNAEQDISKTFILETNFPVIYASIDDVKFMQVINNLISNALKFTPDGGTIKVLVEEKEKNVLFCISDNGIGIPLKFQPVLFNKFTEAARPGLRGEPSVGLGMSIIRNIILLHQGEIWFQSEENRGTSFYLLLPKT